MFITRRRYLRWLLCGLRFLGTAFYVVVVVSLVLVTLYQTKRALGIDLFPDLHVDDLFPFLKRFMRPR